MTDAPSFIEAALPKGFAPATPLRTLMVVATEVEARALRHTVKHRDFTVVHVRGSVPCVRANIILINHDLYARIVGKSPSYWGVIESELTYRWWYESLMHRLSPGGQIIRV
jgi:hypothetical protein